ncbi:hypothetical protein FBULB1_7528 [Fusarium bulbicola]|nr:hypothetical protein FBULB1_7528 [Fusarium bulbicola]
MSASTIIRYMAVLGIQGRLSSPAERKLRTLVSYATAAPRSSLTGSQISNPWTGPGTSNATPFDRPFYMIIALAVGGMSSWFPDDVHDSSHICSDRLYIGMGKETCPMPNSVPSPEPQTYLWRRCCIRHHLGQLYDGDVPKSSQNFYHESMLRDAGAMTTLTPIKSRLRRGGILYGQMYSLTKEIVDAARTYPFQNPDLRHLALDPQLRNGIQSISGKPVLCNITDRAYLASKRRCHYGLTDSKQRSFGVREEYRISWSLFQSVLKVLRSLNPEARCAQLPGRLSYLWVVSTPIFVDYVWRNINKFTTGFELIRAQRSGGLTTWEQTKMMDMFLRCLRVAVGGHDYSREGALWWSRRELPQSAGLPRVYYGLGFSQTLEQYGYCWIEPRIDWNRLRFLPDITGSVLFGNGTLHQRFMKYSGHARRFFGRSRCADLGLEWLRQHAGNNVITDQILSWRCHICPQQMRADVLHSIQGDLRPQVCTTVLDDHVQFCRKGLSSILVNDMTAVWGNRVSVKSPLEVAQALFGLLQAFNCRLLRYLFVYHWVLPYPTRGGLAPRTKDGKRRWFSIDVKGAPGLAIQETSQESWYWARNRWRQGSPTPLPQYLRWSQDQWQSWVHRHIDQTLSYEVRELRNDQESFVFSLSKKPNGLRRNPLRSIRDPAVRDLRTNRDESSSVSHSSSIRNEAHVSAMSQQVIPNYLPTELDIQACQQVEQYIACLRKQIADGCYTTKACPKATAGFTNKTRPDTGTLAHPLPASNIKTHPVDGWQLATTMLSKNYMPYVIQPENELYAELVRLREQASIGLTPSHFPAPTLELDNSPERCYFPRRWCPIRKIHVTKTFEECGEVNECLWFLKKGLETYEHLQQGQLKRRKRRRRNRAMTLSDTDSGSVSRDDEAEASLDEESLVVMRKKQAQVVRMMETRVHELIEAHYRRYPQWKKCYDPELRELNDRLEKVE